jgi:class 3 adenylate cyclase/tetratricopeptide (TPR) repeat protein
MIEPLLHAELMISTSDVKGDATAPAAGGSEVDTARLRPYLPRLLLQWISDSPDTTHRQVDGSIAFVDISGFTRLSEQLAKKGKIGAEELSDTIGTCFARLLGVAYGNGGGLVKFGGDALLLLFTGDEHAAKAARAAVGMRRALREIGALDCSGTKVRLRMSVGINSGSFHFFLVGSSHRELIVTGPAATQTVLMESTAEAGEIVISAETKELLPNSTVGRAKGPGFLLSKEPSGLSREQPDLEGWADEKLPSLVPTAVRARLLAGIDEPEHKKVTIGFLHFDGTDALIERSGPEETALRLDSLVSCVQQAVDRQSITFLATDIDKDGGKIILAAGAPTATENDEERMLLALREIIDGDPALPLRIGVNRGSVFAGDIGPSYRRTYTVMGDAVNLAARLMAKAGPGQLLATYEVPAQSRTQFVRTELEPFMVKGKAQPVQALSIGAAVGVKTNGSDTKKIPLVGRDREMDVLLATLRSARAGRGRLIEIIGEPGIGKSRLLDEVRENADDAAHFQAACETYGSSTPYYPFHSLLRTILRLPEGESAAEALVQMVASVAPELSPWVPLIGIPLGVDIAPTPEVEELDEQFRRERLADALLDLLSHLLPDLTVITIEDVHWMDEASSDLLRRIAHRIDRLPWLVCVTRRDVDTGFASSTMDAVLPIRPEPLVEEASHLIADAMTEEQPIPPHQIAAIVQRSGGNPLFLREMLVAATGDPTYLPDSIEAVMTARIDRLLPHDRSLLRHMSVLGLTFPRTLAESVLDEDLPARGDPLWGRLREFVLEDHGSTFRFTRALTREAAYEGLPFRLRQRLHAQVGEIIQRSGHGNDAEAELLSTHFFHAGRFESAWRYSLISAERARTLYANVDATTFYERAIDAAHRQGNIEPGDVARVYEALGDVRRRIGELKGAIDAYRSARRLCRALPISSARLMQKQGAIRQVAGKHAEALRLYRSARRALAAVEDPEARALLARISVSYASVKKDEGRPADIIKWCLRAIDEAKRAQEKDALGHAYLLLDAAYAHMGRYQEVVHAPLALAIYEELGDLRMQGGIRNNLGVWAHNLGRWQEAKDNFSHALDAFAKVGDTIQEACTLGNVGEVLSDQGRYDEAEQLFRRSLRVCRAAGDRRDAAYALRNLGRLASRRGAFLEAQALLGEARAEFEHVGAAGDVAETDAAQAECFVSQWKSRDAIDEASRLIELTGTAERPGPQQPLLERVRAYGFAQMGELDRAIRCLESSLEVARARNSFYEVALSLRALAHIERLRGGRLPEQEAEARAIFDRLDVVALADVPLPECPEPEVTRV